MRHLTDEQLEDFLQSRKDPPEHITVCTRCNERLSEKSALARRLRRAFESIRPSDGLAQRTQSHLARAAGQATYRAARTLGTVHLRRLIRSGLAAAAVVTVLVWVQMEDVGLPAASAAQELATIHAHNLRADHDFYGETDPGRLARYFETRLSFIPLLPERHGQVQLKGCCVRHFQGEAVATYVAETAEGTISIVVAKHRPRSLEIRRHTEHKGSRYGHCSFRECNAVVVEAGNYWS